MSLRKLTAPEGMYLTNGRTCGREIYLGIYDSETNWRLITEAEAEHLLAEAPEEAAIGDYQAALEEFGVEL